MGHRARKSSAAQDQRDAHWAKSPKKANTRTSLASPILVNVTLQVLQNTAQGCLRVCCLINARYQVIRNVVYQPGGGKTRSRTRVRRSHMSRGEVLLAALSAMIETVVSPRAIRVRLTSGEGRPCQALALVEISDKCLSTSCYLSAVLGISIHAASAHLLTSQLCREPSATWSTPRLRLARGSTIFALSLSAGRLHRISHHPSKRNPENPIRGM